MWVSFLTAHLNAHTEYLERRIADFETIMFGLHAQSDDLGERETYVAQCLPYNLTDTFVLAWLATMFICFTLQHSPTRVCAQLSLIVCTYD